MTSWKTEVSNLRFFPSQLSLLILGMVLILATGADARSRRRQLRTVAPVTTFDVNRPQPVQAPAYILMDVDSGRILAEHNAYKKMFPASTTKTMTALVALKYGDLEKVVTIGPNPPKTGEQSIALMQGEHLRLGELVRAALIKSANDSCVAIAEGVSGNVADFVKLMNRTSKEIGATHTHFVNPHGLHDPQHYTTAYDLALIAREAMKYPFINQAIATHQTSIPGNYKIGAVRSLTNKNKLLFRWNQCDGVKTGYTKQAGRCLIASASHRDPVTHKRWRLVSVVLHSPDSWSDSGNLLLHGGFNRFHLVPVSGTDEAMATVDVLGGAHPASAVTEKPLQVPVRGDEDSNLQREVMTWKPHAPVVKGQRLGYLLLSSHGRKIAKVGLVAAEDVPPSLVARVMPSAAAIAPTNQTLTNTILLLSIPGVVLILMGLRVRRNEQKEARARQYGRSARGKKTQQPKGRAASGARSGRAFSEP